MIIKVCGMRDSENIREVAALGIDWMGFIFYENSPRYILPDTHNSLFHEARFPKYVGVFVNASYKEIREKAASFRLDYVQLHGNESPGLCQQLHKEGLSVIKAFSIETKDDLQQTKAYDGYADYFLFDTKCKNHGGSGKQFDWSVLESYKGKTPFLLSGGIGPEDTENIKRFCHPGWAGIDLNSRFETAPGFKNIRKLKEFIQSINKHN